MKRLVKTYLGDDLYLTAKDAYRRLARSYRKLGGARMLFASQRALPDFIIVGAQKGGTSSLYSYLSRHSRVIPATRKEIHYFDLFQTRSESWYRSHFPLMKTLERKRAITCEASPYYLYHPHVPKRMAALVPDVKLIVCLRNPVNRAISHYWHEFQRGRETLPMDEAFRQERDRIEPEKRKVAEDESYVSVGHQHHSYIDRGIYVDQLVRFSEHFDRKNILVLRSEDLFKESQKTYDQVAQFLGLPSEPLLDQRARNTGSYKGETKPELKAELASFFEPYNQRLYDYLGLTSPWW